MESHRKEKKKIVGSIIGTNLYSSPRLRLGYSKFKAAWTVEGVESQPGQLPSPTWCFGKIVKISHLDFFPKKKKKRLKIQLSGTQLSVCLTCLRSQVQFPVPARKKEKREREIWKDQNLGFRVGSLQGCFIRCVGEPVMRAHGEESASKLGELCPVLSGLAVDKEQKEILMLPPRSMKTYLGRETRLCLDGRPEAEIRGTSLGTERWVVHRS